MKHYFMNMEMKSYWQGEFRPVYFVSEKHYPSNAIYRDDAFNANFEYYVCSGTPIRKELDIIKIFRTLKNKFF